MSVQPPSDRSDMTPNQHHTSPQPGRYEHPNAQDARERGSYSQFVTAMKVLLPVLAAILVLTVFISTGTFNARDELAITFQEVDSLSDDLRMISPHITGVDRKGRPYVVTADTATQAVEEPNRISMENLEADLMLDDGGDWLSISSRFGTLRSDVEQLTLTEQVDVFSSAGYEFHLQIATIDLKDGSMTSDQPVYGQGPVGTINANGVEAANNGELIRFTGGVRVVVYLKSD
jgi:lipopolysaccharide export system protein LptC